MMTNRIGIFAWDDPFSLPRSGLDDATGTQPNDPNALALATVEAAGLPADDVRMLVDVLATMRRDAGDF